MKSKGGLVVNKIYKLIWSKVKNCYVVASELAKSHTKSNGARSARLLTARVTCSLLLGAGIAVVYNQPVAFGEVTGNGTVNGTFNGKVDGATIQGAEVTVSGWYTTAWGYGVKAENMASTAWGAYTTASKMGATAWGYGATAMSDYSTAWGNGATAKGTAATAWGYDTTAKGDYSTAWGYTAKASGEFSTAWGYATTAEGDYSTAWGDEAAASGKYSTAWGYHTKASKENATAWGGETTASGVSATAWGKKSTASGDYSTAWGTDETTASGVSATAWGWHTTASGNLSTAFGNRATASGQSSTAWGYEATASGTESTAFGHKTIASGHYATTAFGYETTSNGDTSLAFGTGTMSSGSNSTAFGYRSIARSDNSTAFGSESQAGILLYGSDAVEVKVVEYKDNEDKTRYRIVRVSDGTTVDDNSGNGYTSWSNARQNQNLTMKGNESTAFGLKSKAYADNSLAALGGITKIAASNSAAIGNGATAEQADTVALGSGAVANRAAGAQGYSPDGKTYGGNAWVSTHNAIAVGASANNSNTATVTRQITGVAAGTYDTDAVNVAQLKAVEQGMTDIARDAVTVKGANGIEVTQSADKSTYTVNAKLSDNLTVRGDGNIDLADVVKVGNGADAKTVTIDGTVGEVTGLTNTTWSKDGVYNAGRAATEEQLMDLYEAAAEAAKAGVEVKGGTNIVSVEKSTGDEGQSVFTVNADGASVSEGSDAVKVTKGSKGKNVTDYAIDLSDTTKATLEKVENEGLAFAGDTGTSDKIKLGDTLNLKGGATGALSDGNIGVEAEGTALNIKLAKDIRDVDSIQVNKALQVGDTISLDGNAGSVKVGGTTLDDSGLTIADGPSVTKDGIDAGNKKITNVAAGTNDTDAVNVSQLKALEQQATGNDIMLNNRINNMDNKINKVGAGAAALAALHPMDFDPDDKLTFAAGMGHYHGETAAAIGAFYRPDEKVMFSLGGTVGNGENMVNAGVSFSLDRTPRVTSSRTALTKEVVTLREQVAKQDAQIAKQDAQIAQQGAQIAQLTALVSQLTGNKIKMPVIPQMQAPQSPMFPDNLDNKWAYDVIEELEQKGYISGYAGRALTRNEFAAALDRALTGGAKLDERLVKEFEPELGRVSIAHVEGKGNEEGKWYERPRARHDKLEKHEIVKKQARTVRT